MPPIKTIRIKKGRRTITVPKPKKKLNLDTGHD